MEEATTVYIILALFAINIAGIAGTWHGIETVTAKLDTLTTRLTTLEANFTNHCQKHQHGR